MNAYLIITNQCLNMADISPCLKKDNRNITHDWFSDWDQVDY